MLPVFIETISGRDFADVLVCRKVMAAVFKLGITPLPFASTNEELAEVLQTLENRMVEPALFVVNAFGSEHLFPLLDSLIGDRPTLFLRREMYSHTQCLQAVFGEVDALTGTQYLGRMTPRLAVAWPYGPRNSDKVAEHVAHAVRRYLIDGDFTAIERACPAARSRIPVS
jgi:hypothetical protein